MKIPFNQPAYIGSELQYIKQAVSSGWIGGGGPFTMKCQRFLEATLKAPKILLTNSGTSALELAALLCNIKPGDEIIMPSYTFVSTANAFVLRGATPVFVDIRSDTLNINERLIEGAITKKTKAIVVVHYAGIACEMTYIKKLARKHHLFLLEDAAQAAFCHYQKRALGTWGDFGAYSFHETKNYTAGEAGAILINNARDIKRAEIVIEKGTDRTRFYRGLVDKYTWQDIGSSFLPSDITAAFLWPQLQKFRNITQKRLALWHRYEKGLKDLENAGSVILPTVPDGCQHNGHLFYMLLRSTQERNRLISFLKKSNISAIFHYIPLHRSPMGRKLGRCHGRLNVTESAADRLVRLPLYFDLKFAEQDFVISEIHRWFKR